MARKIKISQCMIVKNEEENIRQALAWGKDIVCEQIVVDTGSTDSTAEVAESLGARVFHFEWCDDFSAAKNYALEQASGDWIAFLDADEYFLPDGVKKLRKVLGTIEAQSKKKGAPVIIRAAMAHLDDDGEVRSVHKQDRIFRNRKDIRYKGAIHEGLFSTRNLSTQVLDASDLLTIMHTGYRASIMESKGKRNVEMLQKAVSQNPEDYNAWSYLAESLSAENKTEEALAAAERVIVYGTEGVSEPRVNAAYSAWYRQLSKMEEEAARFHSQAYEYYDRFCRRGGNYPDVEFGMGIYLFKLKEHEEAARFLELALEKLDTYKGVNTLAMVGNLRTVYNYLAQIYAERKDMQKAAYYATLSLRAERYQDSVLESFLIILKNDSATSAEQTYGFMGKLYDFDNLKDRLYVLKAAVKIKYPELEELLRSRVPDKDREWFEEEDQTAWILGKEELRAMYPQVPLRNRTDQNFLYLIGEIRYRNEKKLYRDTVDKKTAEILRGHWEDYLWLYRKLGDYRSRQCLYGLLELWVHKDSRIHTCTKENGIPFWDMDLIPDATGMSCVCVGKRLLGSVKEFLYVYGEEYKEIRCFGELEEESGQEGLESSLSKYRDVALARADLGELHLDESLEKAPDILLINTADPSGVLRGCRNYILSGNMKMVICLKEDADNLWQILQFFKDLDYECKWYLRCYSQDLGEGSLALYVV